MTPEQIKENVLRSEGYAEGFKEGYKACARHLIEDLEKKKEADKPQEPKG